MFGRNTPRGVAQGPMLQVREIFNTIQGEGPFAGCPAVFIRLTGCNLRCWFCDTEWDDEKDKTRTPRDIADEALSKMGKATLVVITGGEPGRQQLADLIRELRRDEFSPPQIQIETAGIFWQDCYALDGVSVVISPKTAVVSKPFRDNPLKYYWKYVVRDGEVGADGFPLAPMQRHMEEGKPHVGGPPFIPQYVDKLKLFFQPCDEYDAEKNAANIKAAIKAAQITGGRAMLQLHKYFDLP